MYANCRPISNLHTISKIIEWITLSRITAHVESSVSYRFQSAYRCGYSTGTAVTRLLNDVYVNADRKSRILLLQLDLSAAFDTIDQNTLISLSFDAHVNSVCKAVNYHAKALRHIWKRVTTDVALTIASTMVGARMDYCNAILHRMSKSNIQKLQRAQNSIACIVMARGDQNTLHLYSLSSTGLK